jgi:hypothetical protein
LTPLLTTRYTGGHRKYFQKWHNKEVRDTKISKWVNLIKGEQYFLNGTHKNHGGGGSYSVGVEIERKLSEDDKSVHHHNAKEV